MSSRPEPPAAARFPLIDGLRAVAALSVFMTHAGLRSGFTERSFLGPLFARMNVGVAIFFVLSAFLLYRPWVMARLFDRPDPALGRYAVRRAARILPAYWVALIILGLLLPRYVEGAFGSDWWAYFGLLQVYSTSHIVGGIDVAWSLSTEITFYVALPVLAAISARLLAGRTRRAQVRLELAALALSAGAALVVAAGLDATRLVATYNNTMAGRWPWFACGLALAVVSAAWQRPDDVPRAIRAVIVRPWVAWSAAAALMIVGAYAGFLPRRVFTMTNTQVQLETILFAAIAVLAVAPAVLPRPELVRARPLLARRPVVWLGTVSYGIFLWHEPIVRWVVEWSPSALPAVVLFSFAITVACAAASWYAVERPVLRLAHRGPRERPDRPLEAGAPATEPAP